MRQICEVAIGIGFIRPSPFPLPLLAAAPGAGQAESLRKQISINGRWREEGKLALPLFRTRNRSLSAAVTPGWGLRIVQVDGTSDEF